MTPEERLIDTTEQRMLGRRVVFDMNRWDHELVRGSVAGEACERFESWARGLPQSFRDCPTPDLVVKWLEYLALLAGEGMSYPAREYTPEAAKRDGLRDVLLLFYRRRREAGEPTPQDLPWWSLARLNPIRCSEWMQRTQPGYELRIPKWRHIAEMP